MCSLAPATVLAPAATVVTSTVVHTPVVAVHHAAVVAPAILAPANHVVTTGVNHSTLVTNAVPGVSGVLPSVVPAVAVAGTVTHLL